MAKSIMQKYTDTWNRECFICRELAEREGYYGELQHENLDKHHIMYGTANRQLSEHYGLWVYLCKDHHQWGPDAVHFNQETDRHLRKKHRQHLNKGTATKSGCRYLGSITWRKEKSMSTQSEKTGSEELSEKDYERAKEVLEQFVEEESSKRPYAEVYMNAISYLEGLFKSRGTVPVDLLEYARKVSTEKSLKRWIK